ncbi:MAG: O-antigen ligase family protein [Patescibacteria group bacterium]|jgi:O-antigen ligase|nr:O-antigen ligase family protein [Patescibacteria group bacterium]
MFWFDFTWDIQHLLNQFWIPINVLLMITLAILAYLAYKKPVWAVSLTTLLLPTYLLRSKIYFLPLTFLEICIWLTFLGWLLNHWQNHRLKNFDKYYRWPIILIIASAIIALLLSPDLRTGAGLWKAYFIEPIMFFMVVADVIKSHKDKKYVLWALGLSMLAISLLAIYQKFSAFGIFEASWIAQANRRVTAIFSSPNAIGLYFGPIIAIYLSWFIWGEKKITGTVGKLLVLIPAILAVLFTVSQGTWLGLATALVFLAFFGWDKKWTTIIVMGLVIISLAIPISREKILPLLTLQDASGQNRLILIKTSWQGLTSNAQNFVLGLGILGFDQLQDQTRDPLKLEDLLYPHNIILNFWSELGLLGLIGFSWLIIKFFFKGFKDHYQPRWLRLGLMAAMITILIHGLVDVPYFKNDLAVLFWLIIALI